MPTYLVSRPGIADGAAGLDAALSRLRGFEDGPPPAAPPVRWLHSYALRQADGRFGLFCLFEADGVAALQRHAALTQLPAHEILPVAAQLRERPFAPTRVYLVRRRGAWADLAALGEAAARARRVAAEQMPRQLSWLHSYAVQEDDGSLGTVCLYQALAPEALREHARRAALPADEITPVLGRIVFHDTDTAQPAPGLAWPA